MRVGLSYRVSRRLRARVSFRLHPAAELFIDIVVLPFLLAWFLLKYLLKGLVWLWKQAGLTTWE